MRQEKINISGKDVYIVRSHHHVLRSWAEIRRSLTSAPALLTLDHHTDTRPPFHRHRYQLAPGAHGEEKEKAMGALLPGMIADLRYDDEASVVRAIRMLNNDEHVRTAIMAGIMSRGYVVNLSGEDYSERHVIYLTGAECALGCEKRPHDDDCLPVHSAQVLESDYLNHELGQLDAKAGKDGLPLVESEPYVLDIDLDYFHSEKAIEPQDPQTFYRVVRNSIAVTIATEPDYVKSCRDKGSRVTADYLLSRMKQHIEAAMT